MSTSMKDQLMQSFGNITKNDEEVKNKAPEEKKTEKKPEPQKKVSASSVLENDDIRRINTTLPGKAITYLRIRAAQEGVYKGQIAYMLSKLVQEDMTKHKDIIL